MAVKWDDLSDEEKHWLKEIAQGPAPMLPSAVADQLRARGLLEEKLGGPGLSSEGKRLWSTYIVQIRRARGEL
jgi:hypothetical protein